MSAITKYFSLQGRLSFAARLPNGKPGAIHWAQNASALQLALEVSEESIKESHSGSRAKDFVMSIENAITTSYTLYGFTIANLAAALWASRFNVVSGSVTGEPLPAALAVGDYFKLNHEGTSDWDLEDSTVSPVALIPGTHYAVTSAFAGMGEILSVTGLTQPILADYDYAATNALALLQQQPDEGYLMFDGIDTVSKSRAYLQIPRHQSKPISGLQLINNEGAGTMEFTGEALYDGQDPDFPLGKFVLAAA